VPDRTGGLRFKGLDYLGGTIDYEFTATAITVTTGAAGRAWAVRGLCIVEEAAGTVHKLKAGKGARTVLPLAGMAFPAALGPCA
jgi:hypothetical protein